MEADELKRKNFPDNDENKRNNDKEFSLLLKNLEKASSDNKRMEGQVKELLESKLEKEKKAEELKNEIV